MRNEKKRVGAWRVNMRMSSWREHNEVREEEVVEKVTDVNKTI